MIQGQNFNANLTSLKTQKTNINTRKPSLITGGVKRMELNRRMSLYNWGMHKSTFNFNSETKDNKN